MLEARQRRLSALQDDLEAATRQLSMENDEVARNRQRRRIEALEQELQLLSDEMAAMTRAGARDAKGETKAQDSSGEGQQVFGTGRRSALFVGVDYYEDLYSYGRLDVCVTDAEQISKCFTGAGFHPEDIRLLTDRTGELPARDNILTVFKSLADATEADDLLLFYYSGHGQADDKDTYLIGRTGRFNNPQHTAVRLSDIKEIIQNAQARAKVIILDACHSGAKIARKGTEPMSEEFIQNVFDQAEGIAILASCKQGEVSWVHDSENSSVFTHFLLEALSGRADFDQKRFLTVQDVNRYVLNGVKRWAISKSRSQNPTFQYEASGDIILADYR
jgi:hypothetical protein